MVSDDFDFIGDADSVAFLQENCFIFFPRNWNRSSYPEVLQGTGIACVYIYVYICVCVCVCVIVESQSQLPATVKQLQNITEESCDL